MQLTIILTTLLNTFAISPDLCAEVYVDANGDPYTDFVGQTLSRYCQWTGPGAPVLDSDVCCLINDDSAGCWLPDSTGRCSGGSKWYCEYGEAVAGGVVCYQPLPSMCDAGLCVQAPDVPPPSSQLPHVACCSEGGVCQVVDLNESVADCEGYILSCQNGVLNDDGTVECYD